MRYAGLDLGATFVKAAVLDTSGGTLREVRRRPFPPFLSDRPVGYREVDALQIVETTRALLEETMRLAPDCAGCWVSSQMHGVVLCDAHGRPRSPFISWQDQRSLTNAGEASAFDAVKAQLTKEDIAALGNELRPGVALTTLAALWRAGALPDGLYPTPLGDFVLANLGAMPPATSPTQAAALGAYDVAAGRWHETVLRRLSLDALAWPRICDDLAPWGEIRIAGHNVPCHPTVGDHQASVLGAGLQPGELSINIATGSQASMFHATGAAGDFQLRPFFDRGFLRTITHLPAGRALNALIGLLTELAEKPVADPWQWIADAVEVGGGTDIAADVSFFTCATGHEGSLLHLTEENLHIGPLFRSVFAAMSRNYDQAAGRLAPERNWSRVVFSGGLARRLAPLREAILGRVGLLHRVAVQEEDALFGLLTLARSFEARGPVLVTARELQIQEEL